MVSHTELLINHGNLHDTCPKKHSNIICINVCNCTVNVTFSVKKKKKKHFMLSYLFLYFHLLKISELSL